MTSPNIVSDVVKGTSSALNIKNLIMLTIVTVIVSLIVSKALKQTVIITDNEGKKIAEGDIQTSLKPFKKA